MIKEAATLVLIVGTSVALIERATSFINSNRNPSIWSIIFLTLWLGMTMLAVS